MKNVIYLVMCMIILSACERKIETIIEYREKEYSWKELGGSLLANSHYAGNALHTIGYDGYYTYSTEVIERNLIRFSYPHNYKMPMTDEYYVGFDKQGDYIQFVPYSDPVSSQNDLVFSMNRYDSTFANFEIQRDYYGECVPVTSENHCLIPYSTINNGTIFLLIKLDLQYPYGPPTLYLDTLSSKRIPSKEYFESQYDNGAIRNMIDCFGNFIVSTWSNTYKIDTTGNLYKVHDKSIGRFFYNKDELFGISGYTILTTNDKGETWLEIGQLDDNKYSNYCYTLINDTLIAYYNTEIFKMDISDNSLNSIPLDNDGLESKITSINKMNDSAVYISTLYGGYYKPISTFFNIKNE